MNPLKKLRAESGLSLRELSKLAKVDQSTISQVENDRQKAQLITLGKLVRVFSEVLQRPIDLEVLESLVDTSAVARGKKGGSPSHRAAHYANIPAIIIEVPVSQETPGSDSTNKD